MEKHIEIPCPWGCGYIFDSFAIIDGPKEAVPRDGDFSVCLECGNLLEFRIKENDLRIIKASPLAIIRLPEEIFNRITRVSDTIKKFNTMGSRSKNKIFTHDELKKMSLATAQGELANEVYKSGYLIESLERAGKIGGNGHHIRQELAQMAMNLLKDRWYHAIDPIPEEDHENKS